MYSHEINWRVFLMNVECDNCGEHTLDCRCDNWKITMDEDTDTLQLFFKLLEKHIDKCEEE